MRTLLYQKIQLTQSMALIFPQIHISSLWETECLLYGYTNSIAGMLYFSR